MSYHDRRTLSLAGTDFSEQSRAETEELFHTCLREGIHGFCISPYENGQQPGDSLTEEQLRRRLAILKPHTRWIRSFSCTEGNEIIPRIAHGMGMKTLVGAWLGEDEEKNEAEVAALIEAARAGHVDIAAVGNEVLYRDDLPEERLLEHIHRVQRALPDVTVGYVDAYYEFELHPEVVDACDVVLANCYPYWEKCHFDYSLVYMKQMYERAVRAALGKRVIIAETGWPSSGTGLGDAHPSELNAMRYFIRAQQWSREAAIDLFYFSSFDESWKVGDEGDVGAHWGLWGSDEKLKY